MADHFEPVPPTGPVRLAVLPPGFAAIREALRTLACYVIAPFRKSRTGRIGLRAVDGGFGTPSFDDGSRIVVHGDQLVGPASSAPITSLRAAAEFLSFELSPEPDVGHDVPPYTPDADLAVDAEASLALGAWYGLAQRVLDEVAASNNYAVSEAQLWPEHFDLAVTVDLDERVRVNVGFSPGDGFEPHPYLYVGPRDTTGLSGAFWNAPFGAYHRYDALRGTADPARAALSFVDTGLGLINPRKSAGAKVQKAGEDPKKVPEPRRPGATHRGGTDATRS